MQPLSKNKYYVLILVLYLTGACQVPSWSLNRIYKDQNKLYAFYTNCYINHYDVSNHAVTFGDEICQTPSKDVITPNAQKSIGKVDLICHKLPDSFTLDSVKVIEYLLGNMVIGGSTSFMEKHLLSTTDGEGNYFNSHHKRRVDFAILYHIYYDFYLQENPQKYHNIVLVNKKDSASNCYPLLSNQNPIYGYLPQLYEEEPIYKDSMLLTLFDCYQKWLKRIQEIGYQRAKILGIHPFEDCACFFKRIPNDTTYFSRYPKMK